MQRRGRSQNGSMTTRRERGAAAVEMAIVLPLLLLILGGTIDLGRLVYAEIIVANAAREGVRLAALGYPDAAVSTRVAAAAPNIGAVGGLGATAVTPCPASPAPRDTASVTVSTASFDWFLLGAFGFVDAPQPSGTATMRCLG